MEEEQKARSDQLADRDFFGTPEAGEVLREHQDAQRRLDRVSERCKTAARELEAATEKLEGSGRR